MLLKRAFIWYATWHIFLYKKISRCSQTGTCPNYNYLPYTVPDPDHLFPYLWTTTATPEVNYRTNIPVQTMHPFTFFKTTISISRENRVCSPQESRPPQQQQNYTSLKDGGDTFNVNELAVGALSVITFLSGGNFVKDEVVRYQVKTKQEGA